MVDSMVIFLCFWFASAAAGALLFVVVRPRVNDFRANGRKAQEHLFEMMDQLAASKANLLRCQELVVEEQRAFRELKGAASLEALERRCRNFLAAASALVALTVEAGTLEGEIELVQKRHGRFFYLYFLRSSAQTALSMCRQAQNLKQRLTADAAVSVRHQEAS